MRLVSEGQELFLKSHLLVLSYVKLRFAQLKKVGKLTQSNSAPGDGVGL